MSKLIKKGLVAAVALSAAAAFAPAQAYVMSSAVVDLSDFKILGSNGVQLDASNFSFLTFTTTAGQNVQLTPGVLISNNLAAVTAIDFLPICTGGGCNPILPNNSFPKLTAPPVAGNYAAADQLESGSPITGLPAFPTNARVANGSYSGLTTGSFTSSADSNNNLNSSFRFILAQSTGITFDFLVDAFLQVAVSADEIFPGFATANYDINFTITDLSTGIDVWTFSPQVFGPGVSNTLSLNAPLPIDLQLIRNTGGPIGFSSTTPTLASGTLYQLSARNNTNADAARVQATPEPALLSLVGVGLLAAGLGLRRRPKAA